MFKSRNSHVSLRRLALIVFGWIVTWSVQGNAFIYKVVAWENAKLRKWVITGCDMHILGTIDENNKQAKDVDKRVFQVFEDHKRRLRILAEAKALYLLEKSVPDLTGETVLKHLGQPPEKTKASTWIGDDLARFFYRKEPPYKFVSLSGIDPRLHLSIWQDENPEMKRVWHTLTLWHVTQTGKHHTPMMDFMEKNADDPLTIAIQKIQKLTESDISEVKGRFKVCLEKSGRFQDISEQCERLGIEPIEDMSLPSVKELVDLFGFYEGDLEGLRKFLRENPELFMRTLDAIALWEVAKPSAENFNFLLVGGLHCDNLAPSFTSLGFSRAFESKDLFPDLKKALEDESLNEEIIETKLLRIPHGLEAEINSIFEKIGALAR